MKPYSRARLVFLPLASVVEKIVGGLQAARPTLYSLPPTYFVSLEPAPLLNLKNA
jgi:hypothetical protein